MTAPEPRAQASPIKDGNVKDFAGRFNRTLSAVLEKLLPQLARLDAPGGSREDLISLRMNVAGGTVRAEGLALLLPKPRRYDLSLDLDGLQEPDPKGAPLKVDGIFQFDFITHGRNLADGLFRGVLRLGGKFRGQTEIYGEVRNGKIIGLVAETPSGNSRSGKRPSPFVSYTGTLAGGGYYAAGNADGPGKDAKFSEPTGIAVDDDGMIYVADQANDSLRRVTPKGNVSTLLDDLKEPDDLSFDGGGDLILSQQGGTPLARYNIDTELLEPIVFNLTEEGEDLCGRILGSCDGRSPLGTMQSVHGIDVQGGVTYATQSHYPPSIKMVLPDGNVTTVHRADTGGREGGDCGAAGINGGTQDVAAGNEGELYFAIRQTGCYGILVLEPDGSVRTLAGKLDEFGSKDGTGQGARFFDPTGLAFDGTRYLYVSDSNNGMIRRVDVTTGEVLRVAGCPEREEGRTCSADFTDGNRDRADFYLPAGMSLDEWGDIYVADKRNNAVRVVRMVNDPEREPVVYGFTPFAVTRGRVATVEVTGDNLGLAEAADLGAGVTIDELRHAGDRSLFLDVSVDAAAAPGPRTLTIDTPYGSVSPPAELSFQVLADDVRGATVSTIAGTGSWTPTINDGPASVAQFGFPTGMDAQDEDRLLVVDTLEQRVRLIATKDGAAQELLELMLYASGATSALSGIVAGLGIAGQILAGLGVVDILVGASEDTLRPFVAQAVEEMCNQVDADCTRLAMPWAGPPVVSGSQDGIRLNSTFFLPTDVASAGSGRFFIADAGNSRVRTVGVDPTGDKTEPAPYYTFSLDRMKERPMSVVGGPGDSVLAATPGTYMIHQIGLKEDGVFSTFAGVEGKIGCTMTNEGHALGVPLGMDRQNDATYVADPYCQTIWRIEDGTVYDIRGSVRLPGPALGPCSDGPAGLANFGAPIDVAVDSVGNIWFIDGVCGSIRVVRNLLNDQNALGKAEQIGTFLGYAEGHIPDSLAVEFAQLLEGLDENFLTTNSWWVTTVAGSMTGEQGFVDGPAEDARFFLPTGIAVTDDGDTTKVYVSDLGNLRVRMLTVPEGNL
jgi:sugar lactone lactonase YvrE